MNKIRSRYLTDSIREDLQDRKMVFIGGPRQVGKTSLSLSLIPTIDEKHPAYLNWDRTDDRRRILVGELPLEYPLIVLDEIHKFARWRNLLKGFYDTTKSSNQYIITGSARLDYYRKGGDSLQGRYHYYRLHPFSLGELSAHPTAGDLETLLKFGGFPEPLFKATERHWRRWQRERLTRVIREDLQDLERVKEISLIELLVEALPTRVGSPLSIKNLREELQVSHEAVDRWIGILERMYLCFRIPPFGSPKLRAVKKEQKLYFWDWSQVPDSNGIRFENLVASQLLKFCHWQEDTQGHAMELRYFRDVDGREVDFVVLKDKRPIFAVECKTGDHTASPHAYYLRERTPGLSVYQVHRGTRDYGDAKTGVRVLPWVRFCSELDMP
jgi:predicted AAA+ superfamily ATPase